MSYALGVDLGTTFTAAAVDDGEHVVTVSLGGRSAAIPSVVLLRPDGTALVGDAANRRAASEPDRVAREFKRRLGDPIPVLLGGAPQSIASLIARVLGHVVRVVAEQRGGPPDRITLTYPANWGPYKRELFDQVPQLAGVGPVSLVTEPEAAAAHYAGQQRVEDGALVAVYDLGGGTFDATVLRRRGAGFGILGRPEGVESLGGIDFDEAVFRFVDRALGGQLAALVPDDPAGAATVVRLRQECVLAKEALSADTETAIPVLLPGVQTEVRLTRAELEDMIRPAIGATIDALRRAIASAGVEPAALTAVLLVGGSSRIPLVSQLVSAELGRPIAVDVHPKHVVALGAAALASGRAGFQPTEEPPGAGAAAEPVTVPAGGPGGLGSGGLGPGGLGSAGGGQGGAPWPVPRPLNGRPASGGPGWGLPAVVETRQPGPPTPPDGLAGGPRPMPGPPWPGPAPAPAPVLGGPARSHVPGRDDAGGDRVGGATGRGEAGGGRSRGAGRVRVLSIGLAVETVLLVVAVVLLFVRPAASPVAAAAACQPFGTNFGAGAVDPVLIRANDAGGATTFAVTGGRLRITAPPGADVRSDLQGTVTAPYLGHIARGDFTVETELTVAPKAGYQSGGLLLFKDSRDYVRFERGYGDFGAIAFEYSENGTHVKLDGPFTGDNNPVKTQLERVGLRLSRTGDRLTASWRDAAANGPWQNLPNTAPLSGDVTAALSALNTAPGADPFAATFQRLQISCG